MNTHKHLQEHDSMETKTGQRQRRRYTHLKVKEVDKIKFKLLSEVERIQNQDGCLSKEELYLKSEELSDPVDEASANVQASQELRFKTRENKYLKKVNKTLARITDQDFGECDECGDPIGFERLLARPTAEKCIQCKEAAETDEKMNFYDRRSKSLGRTMQEMGRA